MLSGFFIDYWIFPAVHTAHNDLLIVDKIHSRVKMYCNVELKVEKD